MSKFPYAWCPDRDDYLEPEDIRDFCAETGRIPNLFCPDEGCRAERRTRLTAVCCDPRKNCELSPHFRTHRDDSHSENCQYEILGKHIAFVNEHRKKFIQEFPDANILREIDGIDTSLLVDVFAQEFVPREYMDNVARKAREYERHGHDKITAMRKAICAVPQKTGKLSLVVDMALKLDDLGKNIRQTIPLKIPGRNRCDYNNAFYKIEFLKKEYTTAYILCGKATAYETEGGFIIRYVYPVKEYLPGYPNLPACTIIDHDYRPAFLDEISDYAATGESFYLYSFSKHDLMESNCPISSETKRCVVIEPRTRDCVVIRHRCLKKEEKRIR